MANVFSPKMAQRSSRVSGGAGEGGCIGTNDFEAHRDVPVFGRSRSLPSLLPCRLALPLLVGNYRVHHQCNQAQGISFSYSINLCLHCLLCLATFWAVRLLSRSNKPTIKCAVAAMVIYIIATVMCLEHIIGKKCAVTALVAHLRGQLRRHCPSCQCT